jgi:iron complex transport system ATP-binding protein
MSGEAVFGVYGLSFSYGAREVLKEISVELARGEILAFVGPNGSGKSTLLKAAAGVIRLPSAASGQVRYLGRDFFGLEPAERARCVAYVPSDLSAEFPITGFEAVLMGRICHGMGRLGGISTADRDAVHAAMEKCLCWDLRERGLDTLSGGERQKIALARALAQEAKVLLLDESISKMDLNHQACAGMLLRDLAAQGYAAILVSHDLNVASEWADSCFLLKEGKKVAYGRTREILTYENIRALYPGAPLAVAPNPATGVPKVFFGLAENQK